MSLKKKVVLTLAIRICSSNSKCSHYFSM